MRDLDETRPLEEFLVSLLKNRAEIKSKIDDPLLERIAIRRRIQPAVFEERQSHIQKSTAKVDPIPPSDSSRTGIFRPLLFRGLTAN